LLNKTYDPDSDRLSEVDVDAQTNKNNTLNLKENQQAKGSHMNNYFKTSKRNMKNKPDNEHVNDNRQTENIRETDKSMSNDQQSINVISGMLEQTNLANNSTQANDIGTIQDNDNKEDLVISDDDSPGWSECEDCYGNKKEMCAYCGCSVCSWKGNRGHILLCDGPCGKNFHTSCLNPPLTRIPSRNWYYEIDNQSAKKNKRLKSKSVKKYKTQQDILNSDDEDSQNIRKFSKKKATNHNEKCAVLSNPLVKSTSHNDSSIDDYIENFPVVVIERMNALVIDR
ncbi:2622_t:CDS:2, partial [Dentiscutata heterogama]